MVIIKTKEEILRIKHSSLLVAEALIEIKNRALKGATTLELDIFAAVSWVVFKYLMKEIGSKASSYIWMMWNICVDDV